MALPTLFSHPKFLRLVHLLQLPIPTVLGHLECLWHAGYGSGNPVIGDALDVELASQWSGERGVFAQALVDVRLLDVCPDGRLQIHDLHANAPRYVTERYMRNTVRVAPRKCEQCGAEYHTSVANSKYCSSACRTSGCRARKHSSIDGCNALKRTVTLRNSSTSPVQSSTEVQTAVTPAALQPVALQELWNELVTPPFSRCLGLSETRKKAARSRLRDHDLDVWRSVIARIVASRFCRGENERGWVATFDWLLRPGTAQKALEGQYDNRQGLGAAAVAPYRPPDDLAARIRSEQDAARRRK